MIGSALSVAVKFLGEKKYAQAEDALSTVANLGSIAASIAAFVLPEENQKILSQDALSTVANLGSIAASIAAFVLPENKVQAEAKNTANNVLSMIGSALSVAVKFLGEKKYAQAQDALSTVANLGSIAASIAAFVLPESKKLSQTDYLHDAEEAVHYGMEAYHLYESLGQKELSQDALSTVANLGSIAASIAAFVLPENKKDLSQDALSTVANLGSIAASIAAFVLPENKKLAQHHYEKDAEEAYHLAHDADEAYHVADDVLHAGEFVAEFLPQKKLSQDALSTVANLASIGASVAAFILPQNMKKLGESEDALSTIANVASIGASIAAFILPENKKQAQDVNSVLSLIGSGLSVAAKILLGQPKVDAQAMNKVTKALAEAAAK